jgi:hypothetical protein
MLHLVVRMNLFMGALHMTTRQYTNTSYASKKERYVCPDSLKEVTPIQGGLKIHHFN